MRWFRGMTSVPGMWGLRTVVSAVLAVTMLAACSGGSAEPEDDAEAAWPAWAPLPEGEALGWYHSDSGGAETWGVALAGGDLGDDVVYESGAEDWERVASGTGIIVEGMYAGGGGRDWILCRDGAMMQIYDFPQESTFLDGTAFTQGTTQVYVYEPGPGCE